MASDEIVDGEIPVLNLDQTNEGRSFGTYLQDLKGPLCTYKDVTGLDGTIRRVRVLKRTKSNMNEKNRVTFFPITCEGQELSAVIYPLDLYIVGLKNDRNCYILCKNIESAYYREIKDSLQLQNLDVTSLSLDYSYPALEEAAGSKRSQVILGRQTLLAAVNFMSGLNNIPSAELNSTRTLQIIAYHVLVLTQMLCESIRIPVLADFIVTNFINGKVPTILLLILEHGWKYSSQRLQRTLTHKTNVEVFYSDYRDEPMTVEELSALYDVLKNFDDSELNKVCEASEAELVMMRMYLHAFLGKHIKSTQEVNLLESDYKVDAVIHTFQHEHVVLQYSHKNVDHQLNVTLIDCIREVAVPIKDSVTTTAMNDAFVQAPEQPLVQKIPGQTFVMFSKPNGQPSVGIFSNTLSCEENNRLRLKDLELVAMNYVSRSGVGMQFDKKWKQLVGCEIAHKYAIGNATGLTGAVAAVSFILDMLPCETYLDVAEADLRKEMRKRSRHPVQLQDTAKKHTIALTGKYMGTLDLLVKADFEADHGLVNVDLAVRSSEAHGCQYIHEVVSQWLQQ